MRFRIKTHTIRCVFDAILQFIWTYIHLDASKCVRFLTKTHKCDRYLSKIHLIYPISLFITHQFDEPRTLGTGTSFGVTNVLLRM